jgi:hypothetical protein
MMDATTISANDTPTAGGPLTIKFSQITRNKAATGGGIFAVPGSPVTLKVTVAHRVRSCGLVSRG